MNRLICAVALTTAALAASAAPWQVRLERPAVGTMEQRAAAWHADSVLAMQVRYTSAATTPAAAYSRQIYAPVHRPYRCTGWINITRPDAYATLRVTDAMGSTLAKLELSTAATTGAALTPGVWSRFEMIFDPAEHGGTDLSTITFELLPQWRVEAAVVTDVAPLVLVDDVAVEAVSPQGAYTDALLSEGDFEGWDFGRAVAGRHVYDNAAPLAAGEAMTVTVPSGTVTSGATELSFRALAPSGTIFTISPADGDTHTVTTGAGAAWTTVSVPVGELQPGAAILISASAACAIDDICHGQPSAMQGIQPVSETVYVTSAADAGVGSLRQAVADAANYAEIVFAVGEVTLAEPVKLTDKALVFSVAADVPAVTIHAPSTAAAFEFGPVREDVYAYFRGPITLVGGDAPASNGALITVPDAKGAYAGRLIAEGLTFKDFKATGSGGAVYLNNPKVSASFTGCRFIGGEAANGAAIALTKGPALDIAGCKFVACVSTGSTGGAVSIVGDLTPHASVLWSDFIRCSSTATGSGAGAISVQGLTAQVYVGRCLFDGCAGGRGALSAYNGGRGTVSSTVTVAHCTMVNNSGTALSVASSGSYKAPATTLINSILAYNDGADIDAREGYLTGTNNIVETSNIALTGAVATEGKPAIFALTDAAGRPQTDADGCYSIRTDGPAYDAGVAAFTSAGSETLDTRTLPQGNAEWERRSQAKGAPVRSLGACEAYDGVPGGALLPGAAAEGIALWLSPSDAVLHIDGAFTSLAISTVGGVTVYVGNAATVDVRHLATGMYVATIILPDGHSVARKFIKK